MRIYHNQLTATLNQSFKPIWLIFGDEPWQKNDSLFSIKSHAAQQGFSETIRFSADDKFDWQQLLEEYQSMSLFSNLRIIEIELPTAKVSESGSKILIKISEMLHQDVMLIFHGPKLDAASQKRKWFKALEKNGSFLPLYDIEGKQLLQWLNRQSKQLQVNIDNDVTTLLAELFEGNLLAMEQELQKLSIIFGSQTITLDHAEKLMTKQAKFNPFQLIDAILIGDMTKCVKILEQLKQDGTAAGQLVWVIHKEIQQLFTMLEQRAQGEKNDALFKQYRIWDKRKPLYQHALQNISLDNVAQAQARLAQTDLLSKTSSDFDTFLLLTDVCISLYHGQRTQAFHLNYEHV
ncbi:DNA polymerase III subunit delta [Colwelliaceae bacterium 6471]